MTCLSRTCQSVGTKLTMRSDDLITPLLPARSRMPVQRDSRRLLATRTEKSLSALTTKTEQDDRMKPSTSRPWKGLLRNAEK
jgi:hypothetical protein